MATNDQITFKSMKRLLTTIITILIFVSTQSNLRGQTYEKVVLPGTSISIPQPEGFKLATDFPGLVHEGTSTTVMAMEKEGTAFTTVAEAMNRDYFNSQQLTLISKESIERNNHNGVLFTCAFVVDDVKFERVIYVTGDHNKTKVIIANYPEIAKHALESMVKECVTKAEF